MVTLIIAKMIKWLIIYSLLGYWFGWGPAACLNPNHKGDK